MEHLEKKLDKIDEKLDVLDEKVGKIDSTLVEQAGQLKHHIYRTDIAEQGLKILQAQVEPLTAFHQKFNGIMKFAGIIATGVTLVIGIVKIATDMLKQAIGSM